MEQYSVWSSVIFPITNFAIFLGAIIYFGRAPLRRMAKQRSDDYAALLAKSQETQRLAAAQLAELKKRLAGLDTELVQIKQRLQEEASKEAERILAKGSELKAYISQEAERIRQAEVDKAREQLQEQIVLALQENLTREISAKWHEPEQVAFIRKQTEELRKIVS